MQDNDWIMQAVKNWLFGFGSASDAGLFDVRVKMQVSFFEQHMLAASSAKYPSLVQTLNVWQQASPQRFQRYALKQQLCCWYVEICPSQTSATPIGSSYEHVTVRDTNDELSSTGQARHKADLLAEVPLLPAAASPSRTVLSRRCTEAALFHRNRSW